MKHEIDLYLRLGTPEEAGAIFLGNRTKSYKACFCGTRRFGDITILGISDVSRRLRYVSEMDDSTVSTFDDSTVKETDIVYL